MNFDFLAIYVFIFLIHAPLLCSVWIAVKNIITYHQPKNALLVGFLSSLIIYGLLLCSTATISHLMNSQGEYFSLFYQKIFWSVLLAYNVIFIVFFKLRNKFSKTTKSYIYAIDNAYQITLLFLVLIPDIYLALFFDKIKWIDFSINLFTHINQISDLEFDFKRHLVNLSYSAKSIINIYLYVIINAFISILILSDKYINKKKKII